MLFNPEISVWLYQRQVDMRKQMNGLSILISSNMHKNPTSGELFLFFNKTANKIKILYWDRNGFCVWYKRLEKGIFKVPGEQSMLNFEQLRWLLDGLDLQDLQGYPKLNYTKFF